MVGGGGRPSPCQTNLRVETFLRAKTHINREPVPVDDSPPLPPPPSSLALLLVRLRLEELPKPPEASFPLPAAASDVQIRYFSFYLEAHLLLLWLGCLKRQRRRKRRWRDWRGLSSKSSLKILFFFFLPSSSSSVIGFRRLSLANEIRPAELYCPEGHFFSFNC